MFKKTKIVAIIIVAVIVVAVAGYFVYTNTAKPKPNLDAFAKCIASSGAKFYGAFWCPHCKDQKTEFGSSVQDLPYVECSNADATAQLQVCADAKIEAYPTWVFADGSRESGALSFQELANKTGCQLPQTK